MDKKDSKSFNAMAKAEYYKIANDKDIDFVTAVENMQSDNVTAVLGPTPDIDFDALMPFSRLR